MRKMGIQSVAPKPNTSKARKGHKIYPYRLAGLEIKHVHQVWSTDITYIRMGHSFVYLVAIIDLYSRQILAWEVSVTMEDSFCVSALERALRLFPKPDIFNTDQGVQFTGNSFTGVLKAHGIRVSMDKY
jgi:putative transposase